MKKIATLAVFIFFLGNIFASGEFFLKINGYGKYKVSLNNQTIISSSNIFRFFDLDNGSYYLKVEENSFYGRTIYNKKINITNNYRTVAELDKFSGLNIIAKIPFTQSSWYVDHLQGYYPNNQPNCNNNNSFPNGNCNHNNPNCNHNWNGNWNNDWNNNNHNNSGWNNNNDWNNYPYNNGNLGYGNLMNDNDIQTLLQAMKNATFDEKMVSTAKTALKNRTIKTAHVHQLLEQITFEQQKLDLAKYCYDKTIDKNNYFTLYNDFKFSNYSDQLDKYINSK